MERAAGAGGLRGDVREAIERGAVVVTANERAARVLRQGWDELLRGGGAARWEPARVLSWPAWTASLWRRLLIEGRAVELLLNGFQERAVWRSVLRADVDGGGLRGLDSLAEMAAEAWSRLWAYAEPVPGRGGRPGRMSRRLEDEHGSRDTGAFARWSAAFEERCAAERLLPSAELDARLGQAVRAGELRGEAGEILLVGFDRLVPAQERLLAALRDAGWRVRQEEAGAERERGYLAPAADEMEELRACARWAARWMGREPGARIAVVVPDVAAERAGMERVFREVLAPEFEAITANEARVPYEFSLGRALADAPMVAVALRLLRWVEGDLPLELVSGLVLSDYFGMRGGEAEARAAFDAFELRCGRMLRPEIGVSGLLRMVAGWRRSAKLPGFLGTLRRLERAGTEIDGVSQSYGQWAQAMRRLLAEAGWGPAGTESSEEFQIRERWEGALDAMATLDFEDHPVDYAEALGAIERIASRTVFAPQSRAAPVQVIGPLEAAGSDFDAVWLLRAGELSWPVRAGSLPLLSWGLQRELGMPGTDAERDLGFARRVTERILESGREVVVSYARSNGDARQRASALVRAAGLDEVEIAELAGAERAREVLAIEHVEDAVALPPLPDGAVGGGVRVLELQAACGFRAFAEQRLWSTELESRALGLDARESGTVVHVALDRFWAEVRSQAALRRMAGEERDEALGRAIEEALRSAERVVGAAWDGAYLEMQRERLRRLLNGWLEMELERPAFTVKEREEARKDVRIGPLLLQLRVDRVDVVDEAEVLIDYKTGSPKTSEWLGERPDAPQVPLYAILAAGSGEEREDSAGEGGRAELGAVAFGSVRAGQGASLRGFASRKGLLPGRLGKMDEPTFEAQVDRWREVLERLAHEFAEGDARVRPKNYPETCEWCGQRTLCRVDAALLDEMDGDGEREDEDG